MTLTTIYYSATRHRSASAFSRAAATPRISSLLQNAKRTSGLVGSSVKKGDAVIFSSYAGTEIKIDGQDYLIMTEDDILGIID